MRDPCNGSRRKNTQLDEGVKMYLLTEPWTCYRANIKQMDCSSRIVPFAPLILGAFSTKAVQRACYARRCIESLKNEYTYKGVKI